MVTEHTIRDAADDLRAAGQAVAHIDEGGDIADLPGQLDRLTAALRATGRAYEAAASRVVPAAEPLDRGIASRYQRAAAAWPTALPPSHERFAAALASLHTAADAARLASRRCDQARRAVDALRPGGHRSVMP
jgi:hypothetical protein